jgi:hypothetical protein
LRVAAGFATGFATFTRAHARAEAAFHVTKEELAGVWRGKAADKFLAVLNNGQLFAEQVGASEAIVTDCLRRAGRGTEALPIIERGLSQSYEDVIQKILALERELIQRGDTGRHLIKEAFQVR